MKLLFVALMLLDPGVASGQKLMAADSVQAGFYKLKERYKRGELNDTAYLIQFNHYAASLLANGILFSSKEILQHMSLFRKISWSNTRYEPYKKLYYTILANQAQMANRGGEMLYYAEKLEHIEKQYSRHPSLAALTIRADFYRTHQSYPKVKAIYTEQKPYFESIPFLAEKESSTGNLVQAMMYLEKTNSATAKLLDTATSNEIYRLMCRIAEEIKRRNSPDPIYNSWASYCLARALSNNAVAEKKAMQKLQALAQFDTLVQAPQTPDALRNFIQQTFIERKIEYFLDEQNSDSLSYWLDTYERYPNLGEDYDTRYYLKYARAKQYLIKGDYAKSVTLFQEAIGLLEKSKIGLLEDIDGILYAHAQAEEKGLELAESANTVKRQTIMVIIIVAVSVCSIITLLVYFYRSRKVLKKSIAQLDQTVNLQIESMEEIRLIAQREEQQLISRELHDAWSPRLVSMMHQIGFIQQDTQDETIKPALATLYLQAKDTYESLRHFSHQLYATQTGLDDNLFENRVKTIVNQALPSSRFVKNVLISDGTMMHIDLHTRIGLLRIIQESIINIIKHASANEVTILLYEEDGNITLNISDNGKGFDSTGNSNKPAAKGIGLSSIQERALALEGSLHIESGKEGTSVTVVFPVKQHRRPLH